MNQKINAAGLQLKLSPALKPLVEELGYEFVGIQCPCEEGILVLRLYIDHRSGISVGDCERVSHAVEDFLDAQALMEDCRYYLEVSSPGIERPLFSLADFDRFSGKAVKIRLKEPFEGRRRLSGVIVEVKDQTVMIDGDMGPLDFSYDLIDEACLAFVETKQPKKTFKKKGVK